MPATRKLFLTHAGELAHLLVRAVERDGLVADLLRGYAERHGRRKLIADAARIHELERTIGRESLLVVVTEVRRLLPKAFASGPRGALNPEEAALCDAFYAEFLSSLERAFDWPATDAATEAAAFRRDLEMYRQWSWRADATPSAQARAAMESPFPDRCAILLDPAMMEQARKAAFDFEPQLISATARILGRLGSRGAGATRKRRGMDSKRAPKPARAVSGRPARKGKKKSPRSVKRSNSRETRPPQRQKRK